MKFFILLFSCLVFSQDYYYPPVDTEQWETQSPESLGWNTDEIPALYEFLDENNTKAFLVLKNGKIVLERYFGDFTLDSAWYWASAGKTVTATLVGLAQEQGLLDINEPSNKYLGSGWSSMTAEQETAITIQHHLTMTSGLNDINVDVDCTNPECLDFLAEPGTRWAYHNAPYTLLDRIVEGASNLTYNQFFFQNLRNTIGMTGAWFPQEYNNLFISKPRSMARFGIMIASGGKWENEDIIKDKDYLYAMINSSQEINKSYGYLWWLSGKESFMVPRVQQVFNGSMTPNAPNNSYAAMGKNGQLLQIDPEQDLIMIRMGDAPNGEVSLVSMSISNQIWGYLNRIIQTETSVKNIDEDLIKLEINTLKLDKSLIGENYQLVSIDGRVIKTGIAEENIPLDFLNNGYYFINLGNKKAAFILN